MLKEAEHDEEQIVLGKKKLNDIVKLFQKIERTAPEIEKIKEEMMDIKDQQFRFRELFSELVMREDLSRLLTAKMKEMEELINHSQKQFEFQYDRDFKKMT